MQTLSREFPARLLIEMMDMNDRSEDDGR